MNTIEEKLSVLNIKPIDDEIYLKHLRPFQLIGVNVDEQQYYKMYGDTPMFYSKKYLQSKTIDELFERANKNYKSFCPSLFRRLIGKLENIKLKIYLKYFW